MQLNCAGESLSLGYIEVVFSHIISIYFCTCGHSLQ